MLFTRPVSDNPEIKTQYNPKTNAAEQGPIIQKKTWAYQIATENLLT